MKQKTCVTLTQATYDSIDAVRGEIPRSVLVERAIQLGLQQLRQDPGLLLRT